MTVLRVMWAFLVRDLTVARSYPIQFVMGLARTVFGVVLLYVPAQVLTGSEAFDSHGGFLPFAVIGVSLISFFTAVVAGFSSAIRSEQTVGTLESMLMTHTPLAAMVLASNLWTLTMASVNVALTLLAGHFIFGLAFPGSYPLAIAIVLMTSLSFVALGILSGAIIVIIKRGDPLQRIVTAVFFMFGGVLYPIEAFPEWVHPLANLLPITHGVEALRAVLLRSAGFHEVAGTLLMLAICGGVAIPIALAAFAWAISIAKRDGTLAHY